MRRYLIKAGDPEFQAVLPIKANEIYQIVEEQVVKSVNGNEILNNPKLRQALSNVTQEQGVWCYTINKPKAKLWFDLKNGKIRNQSVPLPAAISLQGKDQGNMVFFNYYIPYSCKVEPRMVEMHEYGSLNWCVGNEKLFSHQVSEDEQFEGICFIDIAIDVDVVTGTFVFNLYSQAGVFKGVRSEFKLNLETGYFTLKQGDKTLRNKLKRVN